MILVSTLRQLVEKDGFVHVCRKPAYSFTISGRTYDAPASVELFVKKPSEAGEVPGIPRAVITRERARAAAHLDPFFAALYTVKA